MSCGLSALLSAVALALTSVPGLGVSGCRSAPLSNEEITVITTTDFSTVTTPVPGNNYAFIHSFITMKVLIR